MNELSLSWPHLKRVAFEEVEALLSRRILAQLATGFPGQSFSRLRTAMLRRAGMRIGRSSLIQGPMKVTGDGNPCEKISIGVSTLISGAIHCDIGAPIEIGNRVSIGHDVSLLTVDHRVGPEELRAGERKFGSIEIGDGAWLASRVVVLPGVRIGAGAIIAAGAVVTRDVPANTLAIGVPARVIRNLASDGESELLGSEEAPVSSRRFIRQA